MNDDVLRTILESTRATAAHLGKKHFRMFEVDTSGDVSGGPEATAEQVADLVLSLIEEQLEEEILFLPADTVAPLFDKTTWIGGTAAQELVDLFTRKGTFRSRESVESDLAQVQALPVVVVRNRSGDLLRLKRREQHRDSPLHGKIVIWAGGHVRREDGANGLSIGQGAVRELQEELRISVEPSDLKLLGAVWVRGRDGGRTRCHVAIVYEWRARTDDIAVALSATEFFERRGTSLSGSFVAPHQLAADIDNGRICEPWSVEIVRHLLPEGKLVEPRLLDSLNERDLYRSLFTGVIRRPRAKVPSSSSTATGRQIDSGAVLLTANEDTPGPFGRRQSSTGGVDTQYRPATAPRRSRPSATRSRAASLSRAAALRDRQRS